MYLLKKVINFIYLNIIYYNIFEYILFIIFFNNYLNIEILFQ